MSKSARSPPRCIVIAVPSGVGKTTFAREFLSKEAGVNPDLIASGLSQLQPELAHWWQVDYIWKTAKSSGKAVMELSSDALAVDLPEALTGVFGSDTVRRSVCETEFACLVFNEVFEVGAPRGWRRNRVLGTAAVCPVRWTV